MEGEVKDATGERRGGDPRKEEERRKREETQAGRGRWSIRRETGREKGLSAQGRAAKKRKTKTRKRPREMQRNLLSALIHLPLSSLLACEEKDGSLAKL